MKIYFYVKDGYRKFSFAPGDEDGDWLEYTELEANPQIVWFMTMFEELGEWQPVH